MGDADISFTQATLLHGASGRYTARITPDWAQGRAAFGGLVAALLVRALERDVDPARTPRSMLLSFIAPVAAGHIEIETRETRSGRALTHLEARLIQGGQTCSTMIAAFGLPGSSRIHVAGAAPSALPPRNELAIVPHIEGVMPRFLKHFELRWRPRDMPFSGQATGGVAGYVRHAEDVPLDTASLLALIDAWPPAVLPMLSRPAPASTVTWMVDPTAALDGAPGQSLQYEASVVSAHAGYASVESRIWSPTGVLLAASRQLQAEYS
jgi:acyl-CoA thioesterase